MANEIPQFFFNRDQKRLFGILHEADVAARRRDFALVYCAPLFEEKLWSHRIAVNFARHMAALGVSVMRFDYFGDGESEGLFEDASVESRIRDILDAAQICRQQTGVGRIYLWGVSFGATLALRAAQASDNIAGVIAWSPIMDSGRYINDVLRTHLTTQMVVHRKIIHDREALIGHILDGRTVNVEGYEIGRALYTEMIEIDVNAAIAAAKNPVLVLQVSPAENLERQYVAIEAANNPQVSLRKVRELRFWTQQKRIFTPCTELFAQTADWLQVAL